VERHEWGISHTIPALSAEFQHYAYTDCFSIRLKRSDIESCEL